MIANPTSARKELTSLKFDQCENVDRILSRNRFFLLFVFVDSRRCKKEWLTTVNMKSLFNEIFIRKYLNLEHAKSEDIQFG